MGMKMTRVGFEPTNSEFAPKTALPTELVRENAEGVRLDTNHLDKSSQFSLNHCERLL